MDGVYSASLPGANEVNQLGESETDRTGWEPKLVLDLAVAGWRCRSWPLSTSGLSWAGTPDLVNHLRFFDVGNRPVLPPRY